MAHEALWNDAGGARQISNTNQDASQDASSNVSKVRNVPAPSRCGCNMLHKMMEGARARSRAVQLDVDRLKIEGALQLDVDRLFAGCVLPCSSRQVDSSRDLLACPDIIQGFLKNRFSACRAQHARATVAVRRCARRGAFGLMPYDKPELLKSQGHSTAA